MEKIRVSIIMGIYNCASTLAEAIDSILGQTYTEWKLIMCDDGSKDNTLQIAKEYQKKYPEKIFLIQNEKNMGLNYTLNHCLQYADTEYIARMDGDDISLPDRLEKEIEFLDLHPEFALVSCFMGTFDEKGTWGVSKANEYPRKKDFIKGAQFCHAACMLRAEAIKAVGGYSVEEKLLRVEDQHLWFKLYKSGYKGYNIQETLYMMRDDRNARSRRNFKNRKNEAYLKNLIRKEFKLPFWYSVYILKPIILGLIPSKLYDYLHHRRLGVK